VGAPACADQTEPYERGPLRQQRSLDYPRLSDAGRRGVRALGVREAMAKMRRSAWRVARPGVVGHLGAVACMARLLAVIRTTFVIDTDRTYQGRASEVRASVHADQTRVVLENHNVTHSSPDRRERTPASISKSEGKGETIGRLVTDRNADEPSLVRQYTRRQAVPTGCANGTRVLRSKRSTHSEGPPRWRRNDCTGPDPEVLRATAPRSQRSPLVCPSVGDAVPVRPGDTG